MATKNLSRRSFAKAVSVATTMGSTAVASRHGLGVAPQAETVAEGHPKDNFYQFPQGFKWGCATAAYQVGGGAQADGRGPSIWDTFSHKPGNTYKNETGDVADDDYHRYKEDVQLLKTLGAKIYRFSVSWTRIFPEGTGQPNAKGVDSINGWWMNCWQTELNHSVRCSIGTYRKPYRISLAGGSRERHRRLLASMPDMSQDNFPRR